MGCWISTPKSMMDTKSCDLEKEAGKKNKTSLRAHAHKNKSESLRRSKSDKVKTKAAIPLVSSFHRARNRRLDLDIVSKLFVTRNCDAVYR